MFYYLRDGNCIIFLVNVYILEFGRVFSCWSHEYDRQSVSIPFAVINVQLFNIFRKNSSMHRYKMVGQLTVV